MKENEKCDAYSNERRYRMKKIIFLFLSIVIITTLSIAVMADEGIYINNVNEYHNTNFSQSYQVTVNNLLTRKYNAGWWFVKATASTEISAFPDFEHHALTIIEGSDLQTRYVDSETIVNGKVNSGTVTCTTAYAIYTDHFAEIWREYDLLYYWDLEFYAN